MFFGPMHTVALDDPIGPNSEMSAFLFAVPGDVKMTNLCACTPAADLVVSVLPITSSERAYAVNQGAERLLALFEQERVRISSIPFGNLLPNGAETFVSRVSRTAGDKHSRSA